LDLLRVGASIQLEFWWEKEGRREGRTQGDLVVINVLVLQFIWLYVHLSLPESHSLPSFYFTLGKEHSANILSAKSSLPSTFFGHSAKTLPSVEKHSAKKNTRQIKNRKK
jgi:hypothetical protein